MKKIVCILLVMIIALGAFLFFSNDRNRHAFASTGSIQAGEIFGVSIGDTRVTTDGYLKRKGFSISNPRTMTIKGEPIRNHCFSKVIPDHLTPIIYLDNSWRPGSLCVVYDEGRVAEVSWWYDMFAP